MKYGKHFGEGADAYGCSFPFTVGRPGPTRVNDPGTPGTRNPGSEEGIPVVKWFVFQGPLVDGDVSKLGPLHF